jgi:Uma2 family endonuclease
MSLPQITWQDVQQLPDDGKRYEAIGGELYVTPAPSLRHQRLHRRLVAALLRLLQEPGRGELLYAPFGVEFPATGEGVQPDLLFVSNGRRGILAEDWIRGAPDLVVEILSPSTAHRDRGIKRDLYERQGVAEYWIVDPEADAVEAWRFGDERRHERFTGRLPVRLGGETVGEIDLEQVFAP